MTGVVSNGYFRFGFHRNTNASDVTLIVEAKTNLLDATWTGIATNVHNSGWLPAGLVEEAGVGLANPVGTAVKESAGWSQHFLRLRARIP